jgi:hypothetical protein
MRRRHAMAGVEARDFSQPDDIREPEKTTVELVRVDGHEIGRYTFQPGWRWSECIKPVAGTESCQLSHVGYVLSGGLHVEHEDGSTVELAAGMLYRIEPGHEGVGRIVLDAEMLPLGNGRQDFQEDVFLLGKLGILQAPVLVVIF